MYFASSFELCVEFWILHRLLHFSTQSAFLDAKCISRCKIHFPTPNSSLDAKFISRRKIHFSTQSSFLDAKFISQRKIISRRKMHFLTQSAFLDAKWISQRKKKITLEENSLFAVFLDANNAFLKWKMDLLTTGNHWKILDPKGQKTIKKLSVRYTEITPRVWLFRDRNLFCSPPPPLQIKNIEF